VALVAKIRTPISLSTAARAIETALVAVRRVSTAEAVGKVLAYQITEHGQRSNGGVACLWSVWNNNIGNLKPGDRSCQDWFSLPGATEFDATGKPIPKPDVSFRAFSSPEAGELAVLRQIDKRWPAALDAALDASKGAGDVAEALLSRGRSDSGAMTWPPYASAGNNPVARGAYRQCVVACWAGARLVALAECAPTRGR